MNRTSVAIAATYFFLTAAIGCWLPVLAQILAAQSWEQWIVPAFLITPIASTIAPLAISAQADQRISAEKIVMLLAALSALASVIAFRQLDLGRSPQWFLFWFMIQALIAAPTISLLHTITFVYLGGKSSGFGPLRVWGTVGWIAAGILVSLLKLDESAKVGYLAAAANLIGVCFCMLLPATRPVARGPATLRERMGLSSLRLLRSRDLGAVILG